MSSAFDVQFAAASPMFDQQFGEAVTIQRVRQTTTGVTASWTSGAETLVSSDGQHTQTVDRTWLIRKADYQIAASAVEPRTGDQLTDSTGQVWEVLPSIAGPAVTSYEDGQNWEIKTKRVS